MGYNLGLMSDFERQLALNQQRHALEKGLATLDAADDAMLKAKYGPRYLEVVQQSGGAVPPDMQRYVDDVVAIGKKAKGGGTLTAAFDERRSMDELPYEDRYFATYPEGRFFVPNAGGLSLREYEFYKRTFEESWSSWALDKNPQWQGRAYWNHTMENAYKAKWARFRNFIAAVGESKKRDREFADRLDKMHPDQLAALKQMIADGVPFMLDGRALTPEDI